MTETFVAAEEPRKRARMPKRAKERGSLRHAIKTFHRRGDLSRREAMAGLRFFDDYETYHGSSGVSGWEERVQTSLKIARQGPQAWTDGHRRFQAAMDSLKSYEREHVEALLLWQRTLSGSLTGLGRGLVGTDGDKQARGAGLVRLKLMLQALAEHYFGPVRKAG